MQSADQRCWRSFSVSSAWPSFSMEPRYHLHVSSSEIPYYPSFFALAALIWSFSTVRRRVEEDLRNTRDKLRIEVEERSSLLDLTHDSIFVRDMDFVITYWNRGAEEFYGWTQKDAIGKRSDELLHSAFPKLVEIRAQLWRRTNGGRTHAHESRRPPGYGREPVVSPARSPRPAGSNP